MLPIRGRTTSATFRRSHGEDHRSCAMVRCRSADVLATDSTFGDAGTMSEPAPRSARTTMLTITSGRPR